MSVAENPWGARTKRDLRLYQIGCGLCVVGIPALAIWFVIVIWLMEK